MYSSPTCVLVIIRVKEKVKSQLNFPGSLRKILKFQEFSRNSRTIEHHVLMHSTDCVQSIQHFYKYSFFAVKCMYE